VVQTGQPFELMSQQQIVRYACHLFNVRTVSWRRLAVQLHSHRRISESAG